jgi:hypothetical protein
VNGNELMDDVAVICIVALEVKESASVFPSNICSLIQKTSRHAQQSVEQMLFA